MSGKKWMMWAVNQEAWWITKNEMRTTMKRMISRKAVGPDDLPGEVWRCFKWDGNGVFQWRMQQEWSRSVLVSIFKNKEGVQSFIKLVSYSMTL